ncbi:hypothetical protein RI367_000086 [Sorochytrium milnesiophthora]
MDHPSGTAPVLASLGHLQSTDSLKMRGSAASPSPETATKKGEHHEKESLNDVQQYMNINHFEQLMHIFQQYTDEDGDGGFDIETFRDVFGTVLGGNLNYDQMTQLFMKIDANSDGTVSWDEFSNFVMVGAQDQGGKQAIVDERTRKLVDSPHKDLIRTIEYLPKERKYLSISRDGSMCFWSSKLKLQKSIASKDLGGTNQAWVTHAVCMHDFNKLAIITDDRQLCIYEMMSIKPRKLIVIAPFDNNPLCITYTPKYDDEQSALLIGDDGGYVNFLTFTRRFFVDHISESEVKTVKPAALSSKENNIFGSDMGLHRRKMHSEWVERIQYYKDIHSYVTCSSESDKSLVIGDLDRKITRHIKVYKGVRCFDFCRRPSFLVTGGRDKLVHLWNPYVLSKCAGTLTGHNATVVDIIVNQPDGHVISLSEDKVIKIWNIRNMNCLQTMTDKFPHRPENIISAIHFDPVNRQLITGSNKLESWPLYTDFKNSLIRSHDAPIAAAMFNQNFHQVVSGCHNSTVSVWDVFTGYRLFQYHNVHEDMEITAMCFDKSCRRLITGSRDGHIKIWNFNNGQLLRDLVKPTTSEVSALLYAEVTTNRYVVSVAWDRRISIFLDNPNDDQATPLREIFEDGAAGHRGHQDDILCVAFAPSGVLATGGAEGFICIWNLETGSLKGQMHEPKLYDNDVEERAIEAVLFLYDTTIASHPRSYRYPLLSCSADGFLRLWDIYHYRMAVEASAELTNGEGLTCMVADHAGTIVIVGGSEGYVRLVQVKPIILRHDANASYGKPFTLGPVWRAHATALTSVGYLAQHEIILTSSKDGTVRVWSTTGEHVGIFGQERPWDLSQPSTFLSAPFDVRDDNAADRARERALEEYRLRLRAEVIGLWKSGYDSTSDKSADGSTLDEKFTMSTELEEAWRDFKLLEGKSDRSDFCKQRKITRDFRIEKDLIELKNVKKVFSYDMDQRPRSTKPVVRIGGVKPDTVYKELVKHTQHELVEVSLPPLPLFHGKHGHIPGSTSPLGRLSVVD